MKLGTLEAFIVPDDSLDEIDVVDLTLANVRETEAIIASQTSLAERLTHAGLIDEAADARKLLTVYRALHAISIRQLQIVRSLNALEEQSIDTDELH